MNEATSPCQCDACRTRRANDLRYQAELRRLNMVAGTGKLRGDRLRKVSQQCPPKSYRNAPRIGAIELKPLR